MKKKTLIILNYQREIPPFMIVVLRVAKDIFDEVVYITPKMKNNNAKYVIYPNVKINEIPLRCLSKSLLEIPVNIWRKEVFNTIKMALYTKRFSIRLLIDLLHRLYTADLLADYAQNNIIKMYGENISIGILSAWLSVEAYAASLLKKRNNKIIAASFAHSFEVNPFRDSNVDLHFNEVIHKNIDNINFISKEVYKLYRHYTIDKLNLNDNNITFYYLGCSKLYDVISKNSNDNTLRIVSCSSVLKNKRLDLILDALEKWQNGRIEWTHIGGGELFSNIEDAANTVMIKNPNTSIKLMGYMINDDVHKFYAENICDLFINVSEVEGLPVSLMECMAYGIPAIATNVGGNSEIVNKSNGFLVDAEITADKLVSTMEKFYFMDILEKRRLKENAFIQWGNNFNSNINITRYFNDIYIKNFEVQQ